MQKNRPSGTTKKAKPQKEHKLALETTTSPQNETGTSPFFPEEDYAAWAKEPDWTAFEAMSLLTDRQMPPYESMLAGFTSDKVTNGRMDGQSRNVLERTNANPEMEAMRRRVLAAIAESALVSWVDSAGGHICASPQEWVRWAASTGFEVPDALRELFIGPVESKTAVDDEALSASKVRAWARIEEDNSLHLEGVYPNGTKVVAVFQSKSYKTGQDSNACKLMKLLAYHRDRAIYGAPGAPHNKAVSLADVMKGLAIVDLRVLCDLVNGTARKLKAAGFPEDALDRIYYPTLKKLQSTKGDGLKKALQKPLRLNFGALHCDDTLTKADSRAGTPGAIDKDAYRASLGIDPASHNEDFDTLEEGDEW